MATTSTNPESIPRTDPWRIAWNILAGDVMLASILLAMALLFALVAWLPQSPDNTTDPVAFSRWRSETQAHFGSAFTPLREAGAFSLEGSSLLRGLIALAALCLTVRVANSVLAMWQARRFEPPPASELLGTPVEMALEDIAAALRKKRFRVVCEGNLLHADRFPWAHAGRIAIYLGALILVISLLVSDLTGWRASRLTLGVGQMLPINAQPGAPLAIRLDAFDSAHRGQVALLRDTDVIGAGYLSPDRSIEMAGLTISLNGTGPAIHASATLTDGQPVPLQASAALAPSSELLLLLTREEPDRFFAVPKSDLVIRLSRGASAPDSIRAQVYRSRTGTLLFDDNVPPNGQLSVESVNLSLGMETFAVLDVTRDPGRLLALIGIVILAAGLVLGAMWPATQFWATGGEDGAQIIGNASIIPSASPDPASLKPAQRFVRGLTFVGWQLVWAILCVLIGLIALTNLMRGRLVWAEASIAPPILAAWLAGCAAVVWQKQVPRWIALALLVAALVAAIARPSLWPGQ
jgi:hypothetical protein